MELEKWPPRCGLQSLRWELEEAGALQQGSGLRGHC